MSVKWALAAAMAVASTNAGAVTLINGGFDTGAPGGSFVTAAPAGWTVTGGSVDHIGTYWQNQSGAGSVDLAGNNPGTLAQAFTTVVGQTYRVAFWLAGNPDGPPPVKGVSVLATGGSAQNYTFNTAGLSTSNMGWAQQFYQFTANSTSTTLSFTAGGPDTPYGAALDSVSIAAIPEPATWGLMILGFGVIGGAVRRRRATTGQLALA